MQGDAMPQLSSDFCGLGMFLLVGERTLECFWALTVLTLGEVTAHRYCRTEADIHSFSIPYNYSRTQ